VDTSNQFPKNPPSPSEKTVFAASDEPLDAALASIGANRKIVIVDDNALVLKSFQLKLKGCGFKVVTASDATQGLAAVRKEKPDAIVLDLNFPPGENFSSLNWDGLHILQWLKRYKDVAAIPIVILTADEPGKSKDLVIAAGAAAYFQKPVVLKTFVMELVKLLGDKPS
jgi:CheY-like chemotaxis protein